jgi:AraC-like DNA-binding protein
MANLRRPIDTAALELRIAGSCDEMLRGGPTRRYAIGDNTMMWRAQSDLCGLALWGRMSFAQIRALERIFDDNSQRLGTAAPCDFILDARRLHGLDADLYEELTQVAGRRLSDIQRRVRRQALLRPPGLIGATVSGFYLALDVEIEWRVFTELAPALAWLGELHPEALAARLDRMVAEAITGSSVVDRVRDVLAARSGGAMLLDEVSRSLAVSPRSLQRALRELGTSFREEVHRARLTTGKKLLLETDEKIAGIARRSGFSSEANFIAFFRRCTGESPAAWRRRSLGEVLDSFSPQPDAAGAAC